MPILICIVVGLLIGLAFMYKGMYLACLTFVSVLLAAMAGLGFGAVVAHMAEVASVYSYAVSMAGVAVVTFALLQYSFHYVDTDVYFHPALERIGGGAIGMMTGLLATGFVCACLLCAPLPAPIESAREGLQKAATLAVAAHAVARVPSRAVGLPRHVHVAADLVDVDVAAALGVLRGRVEANSRLVWPGREDRGERFAGV